MNNTRIVYISLPFTTPIHFLNNVFWGVQRSYLIQQVSIVEIDYYYSDEKHVISDKATIEEIAMEIAKLQLEDVVPEKQWVEGDMGVELILENENIIEFGCGVAHIGFGKQYYVGKDLYSLIMEKGRNAKKTEETERGRDGTEIVEDTEETKPVRIITEEDIKNIGKSKNSVFSRILSGNVGIVKQ